MLQPLRHRTLQSHTTDSSLISDCFISFWMKGEESLGKTAFYWMDWIRDEFWQHMFYRQTPQQNYTAQKDKTERQDNPITLLITKHINNRFMKYLLMWIYQQLRGNRTGLLLSKCIDVFLKTKKYWIYFSPDQSSVFLRGWWVWQRGKQGPVCLLVLTYNKYFLQWQKNKYWNFSL